MAYRDQNESFRNSDRRNDARRIDDRREREMRGDDTYYGGARSQRDDWDSRSFDQNPFDRREGMYDAGGRDYSERMRDTYGYGSGGQSDWYGRGSGFNDQSSFSNRDDRGWMGGRRPNFTGGDRGWNQRRDERSRGGFMEEVKNFFGVGPKGYRRSDERVREEVCEALARHPEIDASEIEVRVKDGTVNLTGTVPDRWMKRQAEDAIENIPGVQDVRMDLTVSRGQEAGRTEGSRGSAQGSSGNRQSRKMQ